MKPSKKTVLVTVVLPDRIGILRDVTNVIFQHGGNLTDLRQNIIGGFFSLNCVVAFETPCSTQDLEQGILAEIADRDAHVAVMPCMLNSDDRPPVSGERHVAAISGPDRPGWVHHIAKIFAAHGVNVEDWRHDLSDPARTLTFGSVCIPPGCDAHKLQKTLCNEMASLGMTASLRHENIFRATNEVGPIDALLAEKE